MPGLRSRNRVSRFAKAGRRDPKVRIFPLRRLPPGSIPFIRCGNRNPLSRGAGRSVFRPSCTVRRPARNFRGGRGVRSVRNAGAPGPLHPRRRSRSRSRPPPVLPRPHCPWRLRCPHGAASRCRSGRRRKPSFRPARCRTSGRSRRYRRSCFRPRARHP